MINPNTIKKMVETIEKRQNAEYVICEDEDYNETWFMMTVSRSGRKARVGIYCEPDYEADCYAEETIVLDDADIEEVVKKMLDEFVELSGMTEV